MSRWIYCMVCVCDTGVRAYTQEEVTRLCSLSDFLVPSPVARKAPNLSRVHLFRPHRWDSNSLDASAVERWLFLEEYRTVRRVQTLIVADFHISPAFFARKNQPALPQAVNVPLRCCAGAGGHLWTSPWLSTQWWPPPWPAVTAWAVGTAAWTMRAKTSLSSQPRPHSSANPGRQLRYRIWSTLTLTDEIVRVRQAQIDQVAGVLSWAGKQTTIYTKNMAAKSRSV